MNAFTAVVLCLAIAGASAGHLGLHLGSGSVAVGVDGAVIAGPAGSVRTNNGLHGHGAGAQLSGPSGDVSTQGGHAKLVGPGLSHGLAVAPVAHSVWSVAPVAHHGVLAAPAWGLGWGHGLGHGLGLGYGSGYSSVVAHGLVGHGLHGW